MKTTECIIWPGSKDKDGYGLVKYQGKCQRAHRLALQKKIRRELSIDECALHTCHHHGCVNPDHLMVGSRAENNRQARKRECTMAKNILGLPRMSRSV
jgi:hypothetical protein